MDDDTILDDELKSDDPFDEPRTDSDDETENLSDERTTIDEQDSSNPSPRQHNDISLVESDPQQNEERAWRGGAEDGMEDGDEEETMADYGFQAVDADNPPIDTFGDKSDK